MSRKKQTTKAIKKQESSDQALKLRKMVAKKADPMIEKSRSSMPETELVTQTGTRVIAVASGKGGVGKTNVVVNLASCLAAMGKRVIIFDADLSLANVDIMLDLKPKYTLEDVLCGDRTMNDILIPASEGIQLIPAGSGSEALANLGEEEIDRLVSGLEALEHEADFMLIDTGAGVSNSVLRFAESADETIVVTTAEPTANLDAYSLIKMLVQRNPNISLGLLVNMARDRREAMEALRTVMLVCRQFMRIEIRSLGYVLRDANVFSAVRRQKPVTVYSPHCSASKCFSQLADIFCNSKTSNNGKAGFKMFLNRLRGRFNVKK
jgi:flagellar biosynthesis protein FlhG